MVLLPIVDHGAKQLAVEQPAVPAFRGAGKEPGRQQQEGGAGKNRQYDSQAREAQEQESERFIQSTFHSNFMRARAVLD